MSAVSGDTPGLAVRGGASAGGSLPLRAPDSALILAPWTGVGCGAFEISARLANAAAFKAAFGVLRVLSSATAIRCRPSTTSVVPVAARSPVSKGV